MDQDKYQETTNSGLPQAAEPIQVVQQPEPEKTLHTWLAPARLYKKRNREFYSTVAAIVILLSIILLFAKEFLLIAVILSLGFVSYMLASVEPEEVEHKLTNRGIRTANKVFLWRELSRFWVETKWKQKVIHVEMPFTFPGKLVLLQGKGDLEAIEKVMDKYLVKEKPEPTFLDKAADWLQKKVPLETE